jgi:hypothetical protein
MLAQKRTKTELKYIAKVFLRTGVVAATWFGLTGVALNALSDRVSLQCERNEESVPECKLSVERLLTQTKIDTSAVEFQQVTNQVIANTYFPNIVRWEMAIATSQGQVDFNSYGVAGTNHWQDFSDRTNRFLETPQLRTLAITSEYSFWFKFLSQAVSGVSILCGLFIISGLYLTVKYGDDPTAHQQELDRLFGQLARPKSAPTNSDPIPEKVRH